MRIMRFLVLALAWVSGSFAINPPTVGAAAAPCDPPAATLVSAQGNVVVLRAGQNQPQPARLNDTYCPGDRIQVGDRSRADVQLTNQPVLRLDQNTLITLAGMKEQRASLVDLARGALHFFSRLPRNLEINTAFVNAGVEGTEGLVRVEGNQTLITIFEGKVLAANAAGSLPLTGGQSAVAVQGQAPALRTVVRPRDAVQWALYYPPVAYFRAEDFRGSQPWEGAVRSSLDAHQKGDHQGAFDALRNVPANVNDPRLFAYRAQLLLNVGRIDEAGPELERALKLNPNYGDALALQSVVALVQNDKDRALDIAQKAVAADSKSASALIALSYAQQANFNLEGARSSLEQAVQADPNNALAWARLAELHMSFAELDKAHEAAQKAVALNPNLSRTQMVLGFANLLRVNTADAKSAFEKAIALDQADSLSRLGLGLARIRESNLEEGRKDIEVAASLDPNNSIVRSYLGKAYYEEKRSELAEREYTTAKELDPKDPTPYFYDAIQKQTTNRPVEALQAMEKAIELNDNRAVYRSQLQLDSDLAARSASLARIYSDLGFQQLALVEGWKSVNTDPTNFSAHRFLADSYAILPRHEIARVSELLQSQLLQPLNMTPIQPRLAESNLFLVSAGGPGALSFNEFNPIFNKDGISFQTSGLAGENSTYGGEAVLSGIYKKAAFSFGGFHFQTNGYQRPGFTLNQSNTDQRDNIGNAFLQWELSPQTSVQAEYRYRKTERGDVLLRFFRDNFFPDERNTSERSIIRVGGKHAFSPNSILLGSFIYQHADSKLRDEQPPEPLFTLLDFRAPERAYAGEIQHLFRSSYFNLTSGAGYFDIHGPIKETFGTIFPAPFDLFGDQVKRDIKHINVYTYSQINILKNLALTAGVSFDAVTGDFPDGDDTHQVNPKAGITWTPFEGTTIRAAAFRTLKRTLVTNQTLEPTQVAGFNQFFDDFNLAKAWRFGGAIDQKIASNLFGGVEFSKRNLKVPYFDVTVIPARNQETDWRENLARTYLFWTPHPWVALRAEYNYERIRRDDDEPNFVTKLNSHRVPLGINFFHPSGLGASIISTYHHQSGDFGLVNTDARSGKDNFWTVDLGINYRLPNRYGSITIGATNLFNKKFRYFDTDLNNPRIQPDRLFFTRITLALP